MTGVERARLLNKLADLMERDADMLAELESLTVGKPLRLARYIYQTLRGMGFSLFTGKETLQIRLAVFVITLAWQIR